MLGRVALFSQTNTNRAQYQDQILLQSKHRIALTDRWTPDLETHRLLVLLIIAEQEITSFSYIFNA